MDWTPLGYGTLDEVKTRLRPGATYILILDADAAEAGMPSAWFATDDTDDEELAAEDYERSDGTATAAYKVAI